MSAPAAAPTVAGPRRARLLVSRVDPWSVMKTSFVLSLGLALAIIIALTVLWLVLQLTGAFDAVNSTVNDVGGDTSSVFDIGAYFSFGSVIGFALIMAAFEIVLVSALATLVAALYNITVGFTGGIEVTLSEDY